MHRMNFAGFVRFQIFVIGGSLFSCNRFSVAWVRCRVDQAGYWVAFTCVLKHLHNVSYVYSRMYLSICNHSVLVCDIIESGCSMYYYVYMLLLGARSAADITYVFIFMPGG